MLCFSKGSGVAVTLMKMMMCFVFSWNSGVKNVILPVFLMVQPKSKPNLHNFFDELAFHHMACCKNTVRLFLLDLFYANLSQVTKSLVNSVGWKKIWKNQLELFFYLRESNIIFEVSRKVKIELEDIHIQDEDFSLLWLARSKSF